MFYLFKLERKYLYFSLHLSILYYKVTVLVMLAAELEKETCQQRS